MERATTSQSQTVLDWLLSLFVPDPGSFIRDTLKPQLAKAERWLQQIENSTPVPGYHNYFSERGESNLVSQFFALNIMKQSLALLDEQELLREGTALVLKASRGRSTAKDRTRFLEMLETEGLFDCLMRQKGINSLIRPSKAGRIRNRKPSKTKITAFARSLKPHMQHTRGKPARRPQLAHELFLTFDSRRYTFRDDADERFTDPMTEATRQAMGLTYFNPTSAVRSLKRAEERQAAT